MKKNLMTESEGAQTKKLRDLLFNVRRSVRYHDKRRHHFERVHNFVTFVAFLLGTGTVAASVEAFNTPIWVRLAPSVIASTLLGVALVYRVSAKAALHNDLKRRFIVLEQRIEDLRASSNEGQNMVELIKEKLSIEADEPPIKRILDVICHNELVRAMGFKPIEKDPWHIGCCQRLFAQYFDIGLHSLRRNSGE